MPGVENLLGRQPELAQLSVMLTETTGRAVVVSGDSAGCRRIAGGVLT